MLVESQYNLNELELYFKFWFLDKLISTHRESFTLKYLDIFREFPKTCQGTEEPAISQRSLTNITWFYPSDEHIVVPYIKH